MADRITGDAPYYRTVPSSPEQEDEEGILLPTEADIIEEGQQEMMSPQIAQGKEAEEEDEEAVLRRRLLEKKREKEKQKTEGKPEEAEKPPKEKEKMRSKASTTEKAASNSSKEKEQQFSSKPTSGTCPKRERIVWNKEEVEKQQKQQPRKAATSTSSSGSSKSTKVSAASNSKSERTTVKHERAQSSEAKKEPLKKSSSHAELSSTKEVRTSAAVETRHSKHTSTKKSEHREPTQTSRTRREEAPKKRPREASNSSAEGEQRKKAHKKQQEHPATEEKQEATTKSSGTLEEMESITTDEDQQQQQDGAEPAEEVAKMEELAVHEEEEDGKRAKKYSKFESSPEQSDEEPAVEELKQGEEELPFTDEEPEFGMEEGEPPKVVKAEENSNDVPMEDGLDMDLPENKEFDQLTAEEKALLSPEKLTQMEGRYQKRLISQLPVYYPGISGCRSVVEYECLNKISEGTFGVVYRAQERRTDDIVALKRLKMEKEHQGFPITSLREINMLLKCGTHPNVLNVREVVVGSSMDKIYMVMEYIEHDMKSLMELMKSRNKKWTSPQVKTLLRQLLSGVEHMHTEYVIHRDLKTSNLLLSHQGILKIGDFGLAREFGDPIKPYTPVVVTLWYRSPELLLGTKIYGTMVDMWSVGCIFGEFLKMDPLFAGRNEQEQLQKIFKEVGTPNEQIWPGCTQLPGMKTAVFADTPYNQLRRKFASELPDDDGYELLNKLLALDPSKRLSATDALKSKWFKNDPQPAPPSSFPTWPAKSEHNKKPPNEPSAPRKQQPVGGFTLKFDVPKF